MASEPELLCIPYATDEVDLGRIGPIESGHGRWVASSPYPIVVVDPASREPVRFNNSIYPDSAEAPFGTTHLEALKSRLHRQCRPWDYGSVSFIDVYLEFLTRRLRDDEELSRSADGLNGLFLKTDWLFSAPRPLPRAHIAIRNKDGTSAAAVIAADFAFWLGDRLSVALSVDTKLSPFRAAARRAALEENGIRVQDFNPRALSGQDVFFEKLLDGDVARFWRTERLPRGPIAPEIPRLS